MAHKLLSEFISRAHSCPFALFFCVVFCLVVFVFCVFCFLWFLFCLLSCWFVLALGNWIVYGLCKDPHLLSFVAFFTDGFACTAILFPASRSLCNDLAKASEALDGKEMRTKHSGQASRQASRASRLWKLEQNSMTKRDPFLVLKPQEKAGAQKWTSPVKIPTAAVAGQISYMERGMEAARGKKRTPQHEGVILIACEEKI